MFFGANYDPYHFHYYRNEYHPAIPQQYNHVYSMPQQEMNYYYPIQHEPNQPLIGQHEQAAPLPAQQKGVHQSTQQSQQNHPPYQQMPPENMPDQTNGMESMNQAQTPFDYFQKPEQPMNWPNNTSFDPSQYQPNQQQQPSIISQFQNQNGQLDVDKVIGTVGQLAHTYHQVAPIVKQFGSFMKNFRG